MARWTESTTRWTKCTVTAHRGPPVSLNRGCRPVESWLWAQDLTVGRLQSGKAVVHSAHSGGAMEL
jgi:hypothetical protein